MKKIKLTREQGETYPFAADIINIFNSYSGEELLENLEEYVLEGYSISAETFNKEILLGTISLLSPDEWDDWSDEEKIKLFDRWSIIDRLVALSKLGLLEKKEEPTDEDPKNNNGKGMVN